MGISEIDGNFLLRHRQDDGLWRDFRTLAGEGVDWPSAFVGLHLAHAGAERPTLMRTAEALLGHQHEDGGWGYHADVPTDADTTACVLLFLIELGYRNADINHAAICLARHQNPISGGVRTYAKPRPIQRYMKLGNRVRLDGWCRSHLEVTAIAGRAFVALGDDFRAEAEAAWHYVKAQQRDDGCWHGYWWTLPYYPTMQAMELASTMKDEQAMRHAASWICGQQRREGTWGEPASAFATALALTGLVVGGAHAPRAKRAAEHLLDLRRADGAWPAHAEMRIPPPWTAKPDHQKYRVDELGTGVIVHDHNHLFTTALCLSALVRSGGARWAN